MVHVHRPQRQPVAAELVPAESPGAGVIDHGAGRSLAGLQRGHGHKGLVGRTGRVGAAQRPVEQRLVDRIVQRLPALVVNAVHKQIRVKGRLADKGQHLPRAWIDGHQRAAPVPEHVLHQLLQLDVNAQHDRVARCGRAAGQLADSAPAGRGFHLLDPGDAVQLRLVTLLNTEFADVVGAAVIAFFVAFFNALFLALVDAADIAHHVATQLTIRVAAKQPGFDVHPGKAKALRRKTRHFFICQARANGQRLKALGVLTHFFKAPLVTRLNVNELRKRLNGGIYIGHLRRHDLQGVGRIIGGQNHAIAVQDQAAVGHDWHDRSAIAFGLLAQVVIANNLQIHQPQRQHKKSQQHHHARHQHPVAKTIQVRFNIAQLNHVATAKATSVGATGRSAGPPRARPAPSGGSAVREATSVGAIFLKGPVLIRVRRPALRCQQKYADHRPQQGLDQRCQQ